MAVEITEELVWQSIPRRARDSHKGTFGSVLAVAGSAFYRGAALLAAEGALRTGAGIVTLASVEPVVSAAVTRLPECCLCPCKEGAQGGIAPENSPAPTIQQMFRTLSHPLNDSSGIISHPGPLFNPPMGRDKAAEPGRGTKRRSPRHG